MVRLSLESASPVLNPGFKPRKLEMSPNLSDVGLSKMNNSIYLLLLGRWDNHIKHLPKSLVHNSYSVNGIFKWLIMGKMRLLSLNFTYRIISKLIIQTKFKAAQLQILPLSWWISDFFSKTTLLGSPCGSEVKNLPAVQEEQELWVQWSLGWDDPLEKEMATHSSILACKTPTDRGAWWATAHGVTKESDTTAHRCTRQDQKMK